jgi:hypothetical protein
LVARIPPTGHPENKYVTSREEAERSPHVKLNRENNQYEVQYSSDGFKCPPIIQFNKFEFLQTAARKLGRDIGQRTALLSNLKNISDHERNLMRDRYLQTTKKQMDRLAAERGLKAHSTGFPSFFPYTDPPKEFSRAKDVSIRKMARDIDRIAPDLAKEDGIKLLEPDQRPGPFTDRDAGKIMQKQILEEANNCWEPRFPENEHVWDWAAPRLTRVVKLPSRATVRVVRRQFFNIRRWPLPCQCDATQTKIKTNALTIQEKPTPTPSAPTLSRAETIVKQKEKLKKEGRHTGIGQPPNFILGETPVQQSWISTEIESHLADGKVFNFRIFT